LKRVISQATLNLHDVVARADFIDLKLDSAAARQVPPTGFFEPGRFRKSSSSFVLRRFNGAEIGFFENTA